MAAPALLSAPPPPPPMEEDGLTSHVAPSPNPPPPPSKSGFLRGRPPIGVTSEFDSERQLFSHRISCRVLNGLAKLRLRVHHGAAGGAPTPEVALMGRNFSAVVDAASRGAVLRGTADLAGSLHLSAAHNTKNYQNGEQSYIHIGCSTHCLSISCDHEYDDSTVSCIRMDRYFQLKYNSRKEGQGEVAVTTNLGDSPCKIELSSLVPPDGLPRATFLFPNGEVSVKEKKLDEGEKILSVNGIVKSHVLNGVCTALYNDNMMNIKYRYKDDELSFIPSLTLPSNSLSFAFKRQLTPSDKFSYRYHFDTNYWSAVYKQKASKHVKWKAGYGSDERLGWASVWVGDAGGKTKEAPLKTKVQLMIKVPQNNIQNSTLVFRVKKRWDF
ncbi:outer envelope pore protein 37, chloroplastic isoform X1 [Triticum aestivum]|uniref:outer envelope pore protein 37, chloroplastic isoform X1 n=1 Tax=Triticum aestivum TaxID=4565 RepID=UPI000842EC6E|nr:outer envelope pore protein 37, chloroplastic-like isoform X1 [Triticum aestivum]XP_044387702.1 outer envelope pore protein 37, chloroplastic-like isoform X1 [Triticum aestivum]XP_044387703.1 outer envelope pore protein 37, chloroplastic-like isoform X1 [Triticum aestivum]